MRWRPRVLRGRLRDQAPVVAMVLAVAVASTSLVGLLAGLLHLAETQGLPGALARLRPEQMQVEATLWVGDADPQVVLGKARTGVAQVVGDVPSTDTTWQVGALRAMRGAEGANPHLTYLSAFVTDDVARLVSGRWPAAVTDGSAVEVNVPERVARERGWQVGTLVETRAWDALEYDTWVVVGTHEPLGGAGAWGRDRLGGQGVDRAYQMPGGGGMRSTVAWGPAVVDPSVLTGRGSVDTAYLVTQVQATGASPAALVRLRDGVRDAPATLSEALRPEADGRVQTQVDRSLDATWREVVVMRAGVVTVGLLLLTLATTVLLLAARLLAERRAAENELLAARGASPADLRSVVVLEAALLAAVTWLAAPWVARAVLQALTASGDLAAAGYVVPPGVPAGVLLACGVVAVVLAVALCAPSWHTAGSSSASAHAGLLRAGGDLALLVLGALAVAQLVAYGSPVTTGADGPGVDLVLVAGPALATLAAATVALRLVGPLGRVADLLSARTRSFVLPLAAWQVARRPAVATGTVLVVVVAVATGTFAVAFTSTWRASQLEQVDLGLGTDLRVDGLTAEPLAASAALRAAAGSVGHVQPVVDRSVGVGTRGNVGGLSTRLVAVDATRPQDLRGRTGTTHAALVAGLATAAPATGAGAVVPDGTQWLVLSGTLGTTPATTGSALVHLTVEDAGGLLVQLAPRTVPLGEPFSVALEVPPGEGLRVVAVGATATPQDVPRADPGDLDSPMIAELPATLSVTGLRAVPRTAGVVDQHAAADEPGPALPLSAAGWSAALRQPGHDAAAEVAGELTAPPGTGTYEVRGSLRSDGSAMAPGTLLARVWDAPGDVPAVVSRSLLRDLNLRVGSSLTLNVAGTRVDALVERVVDHVPGAPRSTAVLVDLTTLARAVLGTGGPSVAPDTWWVALPDDDVAGVARALDGTGAQLTSRGDLRAEALTGPVRVAVPATLGLVTASAALLVLVGVGSVAAAAVRARRLELARLQALGASRHGLMGGLVVEATSLVVLGAVVGLLAGYGLAAVVAPLLTMSPDGRAPVPPPAAAWDWGPQSLRAVLAVAGACAVAAVVVALGVRRTSGAALRMGDDR